MGKTGVLQTWDLEEYWGDEEDKEEAEELLSQLRFEKSPTDGSVTGILEICFERPL